VEQWPFRMASDEATERRSDEGKQSEREAQANAHPPRRDGVRYPVKSASVSADRRTVFLEIPDLKESHVVYIRLLPPCYSEDGERPWSTEAWYTLNVIPENRMGEVRTPPPAEPQNFLTADEKAAGWKLLFDGKTTAGWRGYRKDHMPAGWQVKDGCLARVGPGGDIITEGEFDNFELKIEWRICAAGNSGIFYRVNEDFDWPFFTGPEFQVLDNAEHADGRSPLTSAGSNYALHAPVRDVTAPVGFFNQVRIVCDGPHVEHWLNGVKIVEYELWTDDWKELVAGSKFAAWPDYGLMKKGHIVLQDHGDQVWYRNIKIRALGAK
jgi:cytochrome c